jgi:hypothetical protein
MSAQRAEGLPAVTDVVAAFRRALDGSVQGSAGGVMDLLLELHDNNRAQWTREDSVRDPNADDAAVACAKRDIDTLNARRHRLVEAIDAAADAALDQDWSATPCTESPAMTFDRLSVLVIRIHFTERAAHSSRSDRDAYATRLPVLHRQLATMEQALEALLQEVRDGQKRFVPYQSLKLYES